MPRRTRPLVLLALVVPATAVSLLLTGAAAPVHAVSAARTAGTRPADVRTADARPDDGYRWPLPGAPAVVRAFDPPAQPWLPGHRGVDLAGTADLTGTADLAGAGDLAGTGDGAGGVEPVLAAGAGVVAFAGVVAGRGVVSIDHAGGLRTTYEPVRATVRAGQRVRAGEVIGVLLGGHPGCPVDTCLHWGLRRGSTYLDPLLLLGSGRVRLLPLGG